MDYVGEGCIWMVLVNVIHLNIIQNVPTPVSWIKIKYTPMCTTKRILKQNRNITDATNPGNSSEKL